MFLKLFEWRITLEDESGCFKPGCPSGETLQMDKTEGEVGVQPPLEQTGWGEHRSHEFQQRCGWIHSLMTKFSYSKQDLAAAVGDFGLTGSGSTLILFAVSHVLFAQVFSLWFEIRAEAMSLPFSAKGNPCLIPTFLCLGNISRAFSTGCPAPCPFL